MKRDVTPVLIKLALSSVAIFLVTYLIMGAVINRGHANLAPPDYTVERDTYPLVRTPVTATVAPATPINIRSSSKPGTINRVTATSVPTVTAAPTASILYATPTLSFKSEVATAARAIRTALPVYPTADRPDGR